MSDYISADETRKRGSKIMIPKEFLPESYIKEYRKDMEKAVPVLFSYIKSLVEKWGAENINIKPQQITIQDTDVNDNTFIGFDGNTYEYSYSVQSRTGETNINGNPKYYWTGGKDKDYSSLEDTDIIRFKKIKDTCFIYMLESVLPNTNKAWRTEIFAYYMKMLTSRKRGNKFSGTALNEKILQMDRPPQLRKNTLQFKGNIRIDTEKETISFLTRNKNKDGNAVRLTVPYTKNLCVKTYDGKSGSAVGGNLVITEGKHKKNNVFVVLEDKGHEKLTPDDPTKWVGFDINVKSEDWLTFWDCFTQTSFKWSRGEYAQRLIDKLKSVNKEIDNTNRGSITSSTRRNKRLQVVKYIPRKMDRYIAKIFPPLIKTLRSQGKGLAIDSARFGARTGNHFQENINRVVPELCEKYGVPYHIVNSVNTSKMCSSCGHVTTKTKNKKHHDEGIYECSKCGNVIDEPVNAAKNIAQTACREN
jgi:transposase